MSKRIKIESIKVKAIYDSMPDTSFLGEYTDDLRPGVIVRAHGEFYEKLPAPMERDIDGRYIGKGEPYDIPVRGREYRGFIPYAGGEPQGSRDYYRYGLEDWKRMQGLEKGDWHFIGIRAEATVKYKTNMRHYRLEKLTSGGLWGIESDAGDYLEEVKGGELSDLKCHLEIFNVDTSGWQEAVKDIELEWD